MTRNSRLSGTARFSMTLMGATMLSSALASPALAGGTPAGTNIQNTATATYDNPAGGPAVSVDSNTVSMIVDELLDVVTEWVDPGPVIVAPGQTGQVLTFEITNTGNGPEAFILTANGAVGGDQFDPTVTQIVIDDGDGVYEPGIDIVYTPGGQTPVIPADGTLTVFVVSTIPPGATDHQQGIVQLTATAATGSGAPGTSFPGAGQGGGDAVVGATGADGVDDGTYQLAAASVTLVKSQTVVDPWGGANTVPGSVITYTIVATVSGSGTVNGLDITDIVPTGTTYVPSSIVFEGAGQSDAVDGDTGSITGTTVLGNVAPVVLGPSSTSTTRTLSFRTRVNN